MTYNVRLHHTIILMIITYVIGINTGYIAGELNTMKVAIKHKSVSITHMLENLNGSN